MLWGDPENPLWRPVHLTGGFPGRTSVLFHSESPFTASGGDVYKRQQFAGVSFWEPHRFQIGPMLKMGENQIQIVFTGNAANLYTDAKIKFGILK